MFEIYSAFIEWFDRVFIDQFNAWLILGFAAQFLFMMRFVVQWLVSERVGRSVIPIAFWFFSIGGGSLLFVYAIRQEDPVFIAGQGLGLIIYFRNLWLIFKEKKRIRTDAS